ncbi:MAG: DMT family transporter [Bacillota bacterium]
MFLLIAALAGLTMAVQGTINSVLGKRIGIWQTNFLVHTTAALILAIMVIIKHSHIDFNLYKKVPWYLFVGGILAVAITYGVIVSIPRLGVAVATTAIITGQVLTAAAIDHLGVMGLEKVPFTWIRMVGILLLSLGVRLLLT